MGALGLLVILAIVLLPVAIMVWRFRRGDEMVAGGSFGRQIARGERDEPWL